MKVSSEKIPQSRVVLQIEVEDERMKGAMESAYRKLSKRAKVPGFRPGKAPRPMVERFLGKETLETEAIDILVPQVYREAVEGENLDPIALPELEVVSHEPLVIKATVPVAPTVALGDYLSIRVKREEAEIPPERVQEELEQLRKRHATLEPVERPVAMGDVIRAEVKGVVGEKTIIEEKDAEIRVAEDSVRMLPGFTQKLVGAKKGDELDFEVPVAEEMKDEDLSGKPCACHVVITDVKEEKLPDLDDGLAKQVGEGFGTLGDLRTRLQENLTQTAQAENEDRFQREIVDTLVERAEIDYPPVIVERETERMLRERFAGWSNADLDRLLLQTGKTREEIWDEFRPAAEERIRRSLVLTEVAEAENIAVDEAEISAEIDKLASGVSEAQADEFRKMFDNEEGRENLRRRILTRKTLDRLMEIASSDSGEEGKTRRKAKKLKAEGEEE